MALNHTNSNLKMDDDLEFKKPFLSYRWTFAYLAFSMYLTTFFVRNSFPVAVVAMVNATSEEETNYNSADSCATNISSDDSTDKQEGEGEYYWSTYDQGIVLGAYFWGFILSNIFVSRIVERIGQRECVAAGVMIAGILCLLSPLAASIHPYVLAADRFLIGIAYGPLAGAFHSLLSAWAPRKELSSMATTLFSGATLGGMIGLVAAGWISDSLGWRSVFWIGGVVSFVFSPFWIIFVRNSPRKHPWLSKYERRLLEENKNISTRKTVPWRKILLSPYVHICMFCLFARTWLDVILAIEGPSFFRFKLGLDLNTASYVCGASYLSAMIAIIGFGRLSDLFINRKWLSKVNTRKLFHLIGAGGGMVILIAICLADCHSTTVIVLWILNGGIASGTSCSYNVSIIDFAPNYAGTIMGLVMGVGNLGGAVSPIVTSAFLTQGNGWNKTFYLCALLCFLSCFAYIPFMTADPLPWNFDEEKTKSEDSTKKEMK